MTVRFRGHIADLQSTGLSPQTAESLRALRVLFAAGAILLTVFCFDTAFKSLGIPVPGALAALGLLIWRFHRRGKPDRSITKLFDATIPILPLFFVPATVGIVDHAEVTATGWLTVAVVVVITVIATLSIVGLIAQWALVRHSGFGRDERLHTK